MTLLKDNSLEMLIENVSNDKRVPFVDNDDHRFYLSEEEEKEMLETLPLANHRYEEIVMEF